MFCNSDIDNPDKKQLESRKQQVLQIEAQIREYKKLRQDLEIKRRACREIQEILNVHESKLQKVSGLEKTINSFQVKLLSRYFWYICSFWESVFYENFSTDSCLICDFSPTTGVPTKSCVNTSQNITTNAWQWSKSWRISISSC